MKCPHCSYEPKEESDDRDKGEFWRLTNDVRLTRNSCLFDKQEAYVYGCPRCKKLFMGDWW